MRGGEIEQAEERRESLRFLSVPAIERFNESALRATVRRELAWLLNTTNLESSVDLDNYPQVRTSVLNYGVSDLAGKSLNSRAVLRRAREIRDAVQAFEPRIDPASLHVELSDKVERENSLTFVIEADVRSAVRAIPIKLRTDVEADSSAVTVRE
ncbi:MAG: type VI secretion system baseplate subunit TssE [Novosphingobium sp.]|uniref:type VI secretion system baseplate subunit TssE n=1 Tax=Novosphingobium sp. TaxID=1874826 RepID=UPI0027371926|nr:type VI secretion system baseplate subunit TssE [Novosphingobium sp.]MDP3550850.1 type VI secretion system baseplate subunit TssE [Novosphingobium sp.]